MGIKGLTKLLSDVAPDAISEHELKNYNGRKIAIDASMAIYQFLVAVRSAGAGGGPATMLTNADGEVTSHLQGMFYRTIRMMEAGLKPVYVFDGKPPELKAGELAKRKAAKEEAESKMEEAKESGTTEDVEKYSRRTTRMSTQHKEDCKELLRLMGVPVVEAPCEAEAQCAAMARAGSVWATGSEDMDALTFQTPVLLRYLTFSEARKKPVLEIHHDRALAGLGLSQEQFVDLCILCGCDYVPSVRGVGPKKALSGIKKYGTVERFLESLDQAKFPVPSELVENLDKARKLFLEPEVLDGATVEIKFEEPDEEGLVRFLVDKHGFNADRVRGSVAKLQKARKAGTQRRMDSFFTTLPKSAGAAKRKSPASGKAGGAAAKRKK